ncbi:MULTISPECIES: hypothetical protein [Marinobacter]|uniref:hypothetical protein n=1 Tax=Marinobacter TaxID=2742 RepID=UPI003B42B1CA|nr:hypothetical protein PBN92_16010 [Marinobacter alkaliphilus]
MRWGCKFQWGWCAALVAAGFVPVAPALGAEALELRVHSELASYTVAQKRLQAYLDRQGCEASINVELGEPAPGAEFEDWALRPELVFSAQSVGGERVLKAVNPIGQSPVPVWVTRKTSGVRSLAELQGRDVSLVAGADPVGGTAAIQALAGQGVTPTRGQRYVAADYSSALGLLLHNNTHAAVSELGFVSGLLESQGLAVTWQGQPVEGAGWYQSALEGSASQLDLCLAALTRIQRSDDRQMFQLFPEWVSGFVPPESTQEKDSAP